MSVARVIFMCGPAGSGKSTFARRLEAEGMARLSFDTEAWNRGIRSMPLPDDVRHAIEEELLARLQNYVGAGVSVVLDLSFWSRKMRSDYRRFVRRLGVETETIYLATPRDVVLERVRERRGKDSDDFVLSEALAAQYFDEFEVPTPEEGPLRIVIPEAAQHGAEAYPS